MTLWYPQRIVLHCQAVRIAFVLMWFPNNLISGQIPGPGSTFTNRSFDESHKDSNMTATAERVLKAALDLLPVERAELIERLFQSFDRTANKEIDHAWAAEVESRFDAYDRGEMQASTVEEVFSRINQK
jgi:putative addiction module component (TIGR02574 family)